MRKTVLGLLLGFIISSSAFAGPLGDAAKKGDVAEIERLLASGADPNEPDAIASPLHWAAMNGHATAVELLAASGAILDAQSDMLGTPLHAASGFAQVETVRALLAAGANPDTRDRNEYTPLIRAVMKNYLAPVEALLTAGADVDAVGIAPGGGNSGKGPTIALQLALLNGYDEIVDLLRASGARPIPPEVPTNLAVLGDPEQGRELAYTYCDECHTISAGDPAEIGHAFTGPPLIGLIGRDVAHQVRRDGPLHGARGPLRRRPGVPALEHHVGVRLGRGEGDGPRDQQPGCQRPAADHGCTVAASARMVVTRSRSCVSVS